MELNRHMEVTDEIRAQVADQYRVVAQLGRNLTIVHEQLESMIRDGLSDHLLYMVGPRSAHIMEALGNILNGMDANDEEDDWMNPVFENAHRFFPEQSERTGA